MQIAILRMRCKHTVQLGVQFAESQFRIVQVWNIDSDPCRYHTTVIHPPLCVRVL